MRSIEDEAIGVGLYLSITMAKKIKLEKHQYIINLYIVGE
jgi:hypothetical protein